MREQLPTIERGDLDTVIGGYVEPITRVVKRVWRNLTGQRDPLFDPEGCLRPPRRK